MGSLVRKAVGNITLAIVLILNGASIAGAETATMQSDSTQMAESENQDQAKNEIKDSIITSENGSIAEVVVTADKLNKLTIGQQPDAEGVNNYVVTRSSAGSKSDIANKDLPQSITVVGQRIMKEQNNKTVADALTNVAGVTLTQSVPNYWYSTSFNIRGFGNGFCAENVFVDGLWDPCISMSGWVGNLDRIEVLKGPAAVLYGNGTPGGSINYVTKKPLLERTYTVGTEFGSWGSKSTDIDMSIPLTDDKKWLSRTIIQNADNYSFQPDAHFKRLDGSVIVQGQPRKDTQYTFELQFHDHSGPSPIGQLPLTGTINSSYNLIPYDGNYYNPSMKLYYLGRSISAQVDHQFNNIWSIRSAFRYSNETTDFYSQGGSTIDSSDPTKVSQLWQHRLMRTNVYALDNAANAKFTKWGLKHDLTLGFDWAQFNQDIPYYYRGNLPSISLYNPVFSGSLPTRIMTPMRNFESWSFRYGGYISDIMEISPKIKVSTGVSFTTLDGVSSHDSGKDWRVGATYEATPAVTVFTGYSTSYEPQGAKNNGIKTFYFEPETGDQIEGGLKVELSNHASVTFAVYQINREKMVYTIPGPPEEYEQIGKQTSKGFDLDANYVIRPGWNLLAAYSHCDARVTKDNKYSSGNVLPNVPLNSFKLWTTYEFQEGPHKGLGFGGGLTCVGSRTVDYDNSLGWMDGYTTIDAEIHYKTKDCRYSLNLYNLTNKKYWALGSSSGVYAGTPRSFTLRVEKSF